MLSQVLVKVVGGHMRLSQSMRIDVSIADQDRRMALDHAADGWGFARDQRNEPVHGDEDEHCEKGLKKRRIAGDRARGSRADDDDQDRVEGGRAAEKAFLAEAYEGDHHEVDDHRAQADLQKSSCWGRFERPSSVSAIVCRMSIRYPAGTGSGR